MPHEQDSTNQINDGSTTTVTRYIIPDWVYALYPLARLGGAGIATLVAIASLPEDAIEALVDFAEDPTGFIREAINYILFESFLYPLAAEIYFSGIRLIDSIIVVFFGTDRAVGVAPGHAPGVIDLPFVLASPTVAIFGVGGNLVISVITAFNQQIANAAATLGLAGPAVVISLWLIEITIVGWLTWTVIQTVDIFTGGTIDSIIDVGRTLVWPFLRVWEWFQE